MRLSILPIGILLLCQVSLPLLFNGLVEAKQQCRLRVHDASFDPPSNPGGGGEQTAGNNTGNSTPTSTGSASGSTATTSSLPSLTPFNYGSSKIRGVNIGGWLVLEPWITPSVFESTNNDNVVDEFTLGQLVDQNTAQKILTNHWETWITEGDFKAIKAAGLNHCLGRIPLGYWSVPLTSADTNTSTSVSPYTPGAWPYLLKGLNWARKYGLHVILDIHGAPGSQNGYDNSGQRTTNPQWAINPANVTRTLDTIRFIMDNVGGLIDVMELLNEGAGFLGGPWPDVIRQFWIDGNGLVKDTGRGRTNIMIGDAFLGVQSWTNFLTNQGVLMDFHEYQIFSDLELNRTFDDHVSFACTYTQSLTDFASSNLWTVVGEWSTASTDCAKWLNGRGVGARWDNTYFPGPTSMFHGSCTNLTGSLDGFSNDYKAFLRKYWEVQVEIGERVQGWVYWTWKAENADEWSYQKGLEGGWIPQDPTNRIYPDMCSGGS